MVYHISTKFSSKTGSALTRSVLNSSKGDRAGRLCSIMQSALSYVQNHEALAQKILVIRFLMYCYYWFL